VKPHREGTNFSFDLIGSESPTHGWCQVDAVGTKILDIAQGASNRELKLNHRHELFACGEVAFRRIGLPINADKFVSPFGFDAIGIVDRRLGVVQRLVSC